MKWILGYAVVTVLLLGPVGVRLWLRSPAAPAPLDEKAVLGGKILFTHEWTAHDPLCPDGDGLGPVYNATSCAQCHFQGGLGGSGGLNQNVTVFFVPAAGNRKSSQGVVHAQAISEEFQETLANVNPQFPARVRPSLSDIKRLEVTGRNLDCGIGGAQTAAVQLGQRNTPALFGAKLIDEIPDQIILAIERSQKLRWRNAEQTGLTTPVGRAMLLPNGRVGKFGWKAQNSNLLAFVQVACANELGLGNPGKAQPVSLALADYQPRGLDLTSEQCDQMTAFVASLPRPIEKTPSDPRDQEKVAQGRRLFNAVGCAECHVPNMGSVQGIYSDLLLHRMGSDLEGGGSYDAPPPSLVTSSLASEPLPDEWRTPPLWGVADSGPYLHDGRAPTLNEAIRLHGGQAEESKGRYSILEANEQDALIRFLKSLRAPE